MRLDIIRSDRNGRPEMVVSLLLVAQFEIRRRKDIVGGVVVRILVEKQLCLGANIPELLMRKEFNQSSDGFLICFLCQCRFPGFY